MYTKEDLEQAIEHCRSKVKELECGECKEEHRKLLEMLIDLKTYMASLGIKRKN